ncbi:hypothetical protein M8I34_01275 [Streptomyces sp. MCA2]|uniref:hypothetical protein n=1 Tax=Streptomyces TaxID=1883 RepID=UPI00202253AF|nr:hypothetical protein [Streptomyces sp. MCA2]MCL7490098.1 hypothetical protein [Streptomyces sp. MCA2]
MSSPTEATPSPAMESEVPPRGAPETNPPQATQDTGTAPDAHLAELTARIAELEQEQAAREREGTIQDLARRYPYMTLEILRTFGNVPTAELEERARVLSVALHERGTSPAPGHVHLGRGGLSPNESPRPTSWADAFRRAREQRRNGRHYGEL